MSIETKFLIGLLVLMGIGCLLCGIFDPANNTFNDLGESAKTFARSFESVSYKSIGDVFLGAGGFLINLFEFFGQCILWDFSFFEGGFVFVQILLILINIALIAKIMFDVFRTLKPFGS